MVKTFHLGHGLFKFLMSISSNCTESQQMFHDLSIKVMNKAKLHIPSTIKTQMSLVLLQLLGTTENYCNFAKVFYF